MSKETKLPDQADILAQCEKLTADLSVKTAEALSLTAQVQTLTAANADLSHKLEEAGKLAAAHQTTTASLTKERDELKAKNAALEAESKDFNARLAAELSKHGVRKEALAHKQEADRKLTLTEQCLAANATK